MSGTAKWIIKGNNKDDKRSILDRLLDIRGINTEDAKSEFLRPLEITLTHPNAFCQMPKAVERIVKAIDNNEKIIIYGDFDADGVTSTSLLFKTFKYLGADVEYYIPDRESEGHGMNTKALVKLISQKNPKLIITVDNGISNVEEVRFINNFKRDVIITDHHEAPEVLPEAYAIVNPKALDSLDDKLSAREIESLTSLAGVGVAFKLAQAVLEKYNKIDFSYEILPFVAVGTVADIVPLIGENRYFVAKGLELISEGKHYGLKRMLEVAGVSLDNGLTADQIGFTVAPRINASGRLDTVDAAIKVMISENKQEIEIAINTLENFNKIRQQMCADVFAEADEKWQATGMRDNAIVLYGENWHVGIVGIVASKFVDKYYKPTFIMHYSSEDKLFRCSARGVKELNLYDIITNISEYLEGYGGHKLAAGLSFREEKASFETIKKAINKTVDEMLNGEKLEPSIEVDLEISMDDLDVELVEDIAKLEPYGASNPSPTFVLRDLVIRQKKLIGSTNNHLKLTVDTTSGPMDCLWWSKGDIPLVVGDRFDLAFAPKLNTFNGNTNIQLMIKDIHSDLLQEEVSTLKVYDHRQKTDILSQVNDYIKTTKLGVSVFVEDRRIVEMLKPYSDIYKSIVNRNNAIKNDVLMFFDYPCSEDLYESLKQTVCASALHYMKYSNFNIDAVSYIKTFASMIRYCCNNQGGVFVFERAAAALGITEEAVETLLDMYSEAGMLRIVDRNENEYKIVMLESIELSKLTETIKYEEFVELLKTISKYKNSFMTIELV